MSGKPRAAATNAAPRDGKSPLLAVVLAWILPGAGHGYLRRPFRAAAFFILVMIAFVAGWRMDGALPWTFSGSWMRVAATGVVVVSGAPALWLPLVSGHEGDPASPSYEYGSAFLLTAGLMNVLLILDALAIATGEKD